MSLLLFRAIEQMARAVEARMADAPVDPGFAESPVPTQTPPFLAEATPIAPWSTASYPEL